SNPPTPRFSPPAVASSSHQHHHTPRPATRPVRLGPPSPQPSVPPHPSPGSISGRRKQPENSRFFTELSSSRSPSSGHQIGRVRYDFLAIFHALAAGLVGFQRFQA
ncbi:unnamed protein product, partial [Prunus brigantina]